MILILSMLYAEQHKQTEAKDGIYVCFKAFYESFHIKIYVKQTQSNNCKIKLKEKKEKLLVFLVIFFKVKSSH